MQEVNRPGMSNPGEKDAEGGKVAMRTMMTAPPAAEEGQKEENHT